METYPKIDSVYKRDERGAFKLGEFAAPEFEYLFDKEWHWTEKIDGTNIRIMWNYEENAVRFGGRTDEALIPAKLLAYLQDTFTPDRFKKACLEYDVTLYGEGYGAGIQKGGGNYSPDQKFILFDVKIGNFWLTRENIEDIARKMRIDVVDYIGLLPLRDAVAYCMAFPSIKSKMFPDVGMEGYVGTPAVQLFNRKGERIITKVKFKDFNK